MTERTDATDTRLPKLASLDNNWLLGMNVSLRILIAVTLSVMLELLCFISCEIVILSYATYTSN